MAHYEVFHGMADLYVYFCKLGVQMLKPGDLRDEHTRTTKPARALAAETLKLEPPHQRPR